MHSGNSKCINMENKGISYRLRAALLLFPNASQKDLSQKARDGCAFLVHTEMTLNVLTQLKCRGKLL